MSLAKIIENITPRQLTIICDTHGKTDHWQIANNKPNCKQCEADRASIKKAENTKSLGDRYKETMADNGVSHTAKDFTDWEFDSEKTEKQKRIIEVMEKMSNSLVISHHSGVNKSLPNILLIGGTGTGKTMLAAALVKAVYRKAFILDMNNNVEAFQVSNQYAKLIKSRDITEMAKATWSSYKKESEYELIKYLSSFLLLVIDDVGDSDTASNIDMAANDRGRIADILDRRYQKLPTIITTNLDKDGIAAHLGDRAWDRLQENLIIIMCDWGSHRQSIAKVLEI